jgi:hypothetical protein
VIDADTKEPVEGAVVVAYWYSERPSILGEDPRLKDVKEALTDKDGNWSIVGYKGKESPPTYFPIFIVATFRYTKEPQFIIFKPGYCSWPDGYSIEACKGRINFKGPGEIMEGKILELPKLTDRKDRLRACCPNTISSSSDDPQKEKKIQKKQLEFLRLINEERKNLGLEEFKIYEELKNEK